LSDNSPIPQEKSMTVQEKITGHPSGDERFKNIDRTIKRLKNEKGALLEVLIAAQESFGYLSPDLLIYVSRQLKCIPSVRCTGVAQPSIICSVLNRLGDINAIICAGTACYVKGFRADRAGPDRRVPYMCR
jgi:bidirectional [NiFe] hydrogenase diaphorase subunit